MSLFPSACLTSQIIFFSDDSCRLYILSKLSLRGRHASEYAKSIYFFLCYPLKQIPIITYLPLLHVIYSRVYKLCCTSVYQEYAKDEETLKAVYQSVNAVVGILRSSNDDLPSRPGICLQL